MGIVYPFSEGEILEDRAARIDLAGRARAWAVAHLGWDQTVAAYEALYERLLQREAR